VESATLPYRLDDPGFCFGSTFDIQSASNVAWRGPASAFGACMSVPRGVYLMCAGSRMLAALHDL
jgi:hypothetical protein